jgi:signal transduction histidine kinase
MENERGPHGTGAGEGAAGPAADRSGRLGFVAHEVRNPLATALWTAELLSRMSAADRGGARGEKMTDMMLRALGRVRQLVEDHFLTERLDVAGIPVRAEAHALRAAVEAAAARKAADVGAVAVEVPEGLRARADKVLLDRTLDTLVAGAGGEGVPVTVSGRAEGPFVQLRFSGRPLPADVLLDPVKGSPSDLKGRALALPLARRIAAALGGELRVEGGALELALPAPGAGNTT